MNPVVHFELPAKDRQRMSDFYTKAFGWKATQLGEEMGNYITVQTSETDDRGFPKERGMINGGLYDEGTEPWTKAPSVVIAVDDIHAHVEIVKNAGGKITTDIMEIPGIGTFAGFQDPEGNYLSMLQPNPM